MALKLARVSLRRLPSARGLNRVPMRGLNTLTFTPSAGAAANWAMNKAQVTPAGEAHRNLSAKALAAIAGKASGPAAKMVDMSDMHYARAYKEVTEYLSSVGAVYSNDAALGSDRDSEVRVSSISDSASVALFMKIMCEATSGAADAAAFDADMTVYVAAGYKGDKAYLGVDGPFCVVNTATNTVIVAGTDNAASIKAAMTAVAVPEISTADGTIAMKGSAVTGKAGTVLALGNTGATGNFGSHDVIWTSNGVARVWAGTVNGDKADAINSRSVGNMTAHPAAVLVPTSEGPAVTEVTAESAKVFLLGSYLTDKANSPFADVAPGAVMGALAKFTSLMASGSKVYAVNGAADAAIKDAASGSISGSTGVPAKLQKTVLAAYPDPE